MPLLNLTLAVFLSPEFGFFGFVNPTRRQTPFMAGLFTNCGDVFFRAFWPTRHPPSTWLNVASCDGVEENVRFGIDTATLRFERRGEEVNWGRNEGRGNRTRRRRNVRGILAMTYDLDGVERIRDGDRISWNIAAERDRRAANSLRNLLS